MFVNICTKHTYYIIIYLLRGSSLLRGIQDQRIGGGGGWSIFIVSGQPTLPVQDLNPGPLSLEEIALLTELVRPDKIGISRMFWGANNSLFLCVSDQMF